MLQISSMKYILRLHVKYNIRFKNVQEVIISLNYKICSNENY